MAAECKLHETVHVPSPVSCCAFSSPHLFAIGSEDGSCRLFQLPSSKACKAIRGLAGEVSSMALPSTKDDEPPSFIAIASALQIYIFDLSSNSNVLVMDQAHAVKRFDLSLHLTDRDDVLNEIAWTSSHIAFTADSGNVGVIEVASGSVSLMRRGHRSIAGSISFIPNRPRELVSGGYDSCLNHYDLTTRSTISHLDLDSLIPPESGGPNVSMSPPFVMSMATSSNGLLAVGTADGRLWVGLGGRRPPDMLSTREKARRRRCWEGLKQKGNSLSLPIASGPIVGVAFESEDVIIVVTLGGILSRHKLLFDEKRSEEIWKDSTTNIYKVNTLRRFSSDDASWVAVCGVGSDGKGIVELRKVLAVQ